jgi:general stress protein 26
MERAEIIEKSIEYLETHRILTMATASKDGAPDATALEYASDGLDVYVSCRPDSRKVQNIVDNPRVFYEIHDDIEITKENVKKLKALQVVATPVVLHPEDPDFDAVFNKMVAKFPVFSTMKKDSRVILHFKPRKMWYLNYQQKFFHRDEVDLENDDK